MTPRVTSVARNPEHALSKFVQPVIQLLSGEGVEGDCHAGRTVQHRSRVKKDPSQPNLRQVHLLPTELLEELNRQGFEVTPGLLGENVTTAGLDLLALPRGTTLCLGGEARVEVTGLRNPCQQLEAFRPGLLAAVLDRDAAGELIRKAGVMAIVVSGGAVKPGDAIQIELPPEPHERLERV